MNDKTVEAIVMIMRRAPLQNMQEAEAVAKLIQDFVEWHKAQPQAEAHGG